MILWIDEKSCTGCEGCFAICPNDAIEMKMSKEGFVEPTINNKKCVECGLCERVCPVSKENKIWRDKLSGEKEKRVYAAINTNKEREDSSSGGIFPVLATFILRQHGSVYGAAWDEEYKVHHIKIEDSSDIKKIQGSKYVQSRIDNIFLQVKQDLIQGKKVLFFGLPCQVAALKRFLAKEYNTLYCVDSICHGVPSEKSWLTYLNWRILEENKREKPIFINMRSKKTGWTGYNYCLEFVYENGEKTYSPAWSDPFMKGYTENLFTRKSCFECKFKGNTRASDITLGDFWGIEKIDDSMDDGKGTSAVIIRSERGVELWDNIKNELKLKECSLEEVVANNKSYYLSENDLDRDGEVLLKIQYFNFDDIVYSWFYKKSFVGEMKKYFRWSKRIIKSYKIDLRKHELK